MPTLRAGGDTSPSCTHPMAIKLAMHSYIMDYLNIKWQDLLAPPFIYSPPTYGTGGSEGERGEGPEREIHKRERRR